MPYMLNARPQEPQRAKYAGRASQHKWRSPWIRHRGGGPERPARGAGPASSDEAPPTLLIGGTPWQPSPAARRLSRRWWLLATRSRVICQINISAQTYYLLTLVREIRGKVEPGISEAGLTEARQEAAFCCAAGVTPRLAWTAPGPTESGSNGSWEMWR